MNIKLLWGIIVGAISGAVTSLLNIYFNFIPLPAAYIPGIVFGIFSILFLYNQLMPYGKINLWRSIVWVFMSTIAYTLAFVSTFLSGMSSVGNGYSVASTQYLFVVIGSIGGLIGSMVLVLAYRKLLCPKFDKIGPVVLAGLFLGGISFFIMGQLDGQKMDFEESQFSLLFIIWQAGMLGVFGYLTSRINLQSVNQQI